MNFILTLYFLLFTPLLTAGGIGIFLFFVIEVLYFNIGFIYLLKAKLLGYRSFNLNSKVQAILYNWILYMSFFIVQVIVFVLLFLLLNIFIIYLNIKIIKNKQILKQYLSSKNHRCHNCGIKIKNNWRNCPECGAPVSIKIVKFKQKAKFKEENLNSKENEKEAQKILIGFIFMNFILIIYFLTFIQGLFYKIIQVNFTGYIIFIIILGLGIFETIRAIKLLRNREYRHQPLMINTIGQVLLRKLLYPSSQGNNLSSNGNEKKALKILIATMYVNFILVNFYYSITHHLFFFVYQISLFFFIYLIIEILYFSIGFIILLKVRLLGYRFLKVNSIVQAIFYNCIMVLLFIFNQYTPNPYFGLNLHFVLLLLLDVSILYLTIKIIKNEQILRQYLPPKNHNCHNCGSKMKNHRKFCPKCVALLVERKNGLEELPMQKAVQKRSPDKITLKPEEIVEKRAKLEEPIGEKLKEGENMREFDLEFLEDLSILKEKKDKKIVKKYLLERFVVVSKQTRNEIDKLNISREEKIDFLKDLAFLTSKEQGYLLELLVHLYKN